MQKKPKRMLPYDDEWNLFLKRPPHIKIFIVAHGYDEIFGLNVYVCACVCVE